MIDNYTAGRPDTSSDEAQNQQDSGRTHQAPTADRRPLKPGVLTLNYDAIPDDLKRRDQWIIWQLIWAGAKWTKILFRPNQPARMASSTDPGTWSAFDVARWVHDHSMVFDGIGFVLAKDDGIVGIDIDGCVGPDEIIEPWALEIVADLPGYWETTPSGRGLRGFFLGTLPPGGRKKALGSGQAVEMYESGRFLTVTGRKLDACPSTLEERTEAIAAVHARYFAKVEKPAQPRPKPAPTPHDLNDDDLLQIMFDAKNGIEARAVFDGETAGHQGDASAADLALCNHLKFYFDRDAVAIDRVFRRSGLMRPKWDEMRGATTYGERTIAKALENATESYGQNRLSDLARWARGNSTMVARGGPSLVDDMDDDDAWLPEDGPDDGEPGPIAPPPPITPTPISLGIIDDLTHERMSFTEAPTGSGKTHGAVLAALDFLNRDRGMILALPTLRMCGEARDLIKRYAPEAFKAGQVAELFGQGGPKQIDQSEGRESKAGGSYPIDDATRVIICTHAQLGRRGFSKFFRALLRTLADMRANQAADGLPVSPAFALVIDEAAAWIAGLHMEFALDHRVKYQADPDGQGGHYSPVFDCPKSTLSGNCGNCRHVAKGGGPKFNLYGIRESGYFHTTQTDKSGRELRQAKQPLVVPESRLTLDPEVQILKTCWASDVRAFDGRPIGLDDLQAVNLPIHGGDTGDARDDEAKQPAEAPEEILADLMRVAYRPTLAVHRPVEILKKGHPDDEGGEEPVGSALLRARCLANRPNWDRDILFPTVSCEVRRLRFADLGPLELIRRYSVDQRVGVVLLGAVFCPDDLSVVQTAWPKLTTRKHAAGDRKIRQLALVAIDKRYSGMGSIVDRAGRLVTAPLEKHGLGVVFCGTKKGARALYDLVSKDDAGVRLATENDESVTTFRSLHLDGKPTTLVTYSRGVLGVGANLHDPIRFIVVNAHAFRDRASFVLSQGTSLEAYKARQDEERAALILQNVGRAIRGREGHTAALIVLNADEALMGRIAASDAVVGGCELPVVTVAGESLPQLVDEADAWLAAEGGPWPKGIKGTSRKPRKGRPKRPPEVVLAEAYDAIPAAVEAGESWRDFSRRLNLNRIPDAQAIAALRSQFEFSSTPCHSGS